MSLQNKSDTIGESEGDAPRALIDSKSTGVVYHEDMKNHLCLWDKNHVECPERFTEILKRCQTLNLLDRCKRIPARLATVDELQWKHSPELITLLENCQTKGEEELEELSSQFDSVFICRDTYRLALLAAGSALNLVEAVCTNQVTNGMAIIRPPGHHAMKSAYCGFCFFNNVAVAAEYALKNYNLKKILIVDWDVHHGQSTQQMFYNDPRVLYFSIHRFEHGTFWPNLRESNADYIGEGAGEGYNFNIPLNKIGLGDADYLTIFHQILLPVALEYQPELILASAGYDAAIGCPEFVPELVLVSSGFDSALGDGKGQMEVTPACYAHLVNSLSHLANGKIAIILEGGYFLKSLAEGAALTLRSLLGDACPDIGAVGQIDESVRETILNVIYFHKSHWKCFEMYERLDSSDSYSPYLPFNYIEEVIDRFPTRDTYPPRPKEIINHFNAKVDNLINNTKLETPPSVRSAVYSSSISKNYLSFKSVFTDDVSVELNENEDIKSEVPSVIKKIMNNLTRSVIIDHQALSGNRKDDNILDCFLNHLIGCASEVNRILLVNNNNNIVVKCENDRLLKVNLSYDGDESAIQYPFTEPANDADLFAFLFRILLPVAYQFNPEIVIVNLSFDKGHNLSRTSYSYLVRWLTSLAGGRLILLANYDSSLEHENSSFLHCCKILLGNCVPPPKVDEVISAKSVSSFSALVERTKRRWFNLNFMVKFPTINNR